jgi:hypothetical protein
MVEQSSLSLVEDNTSLFGKATLFNRSQRLPNGWMQTHGALSLPSTATMSHPLFPEFRANP